MSFFAAMPYDGEKKVDVTIIRSSQLTEMRTRLVSRAYELEATHILWLDTDMKFPPDTIPRLLNHNVPVVAVNYPTKDMEARPTAYAENEHYIGPVWTTEKTTGLAEVTHAGMGIMLTDIRVFDLLDPPLFQFEPMPPDFIKQTGEDVYFCRKVREKGIPIFIDHDLSKQVAHIGDFEYTNSFSAKAEETKQQLYKELP